MAYTRAVTPLRSDNASAIGEALKRLMRLFLVVLGGVLALAGAALTLLPSHLLGLPFLLGGLMMVLRNSIQARKEFIKYQRRHPNVVFPVRRLLRREPEVAAVIWQLLLRSEKLFIPRRLRHAKRIRRRLRRPRRTNG